MVGVHGRGVRTTVTYGGLLVLLVVAAVASLAVGHGDLADLKLRGVLLELRAARFGAAFLAGAALAMAGVMVQGLFRNPLASPDVLGTGAASALGGRLAILLPRVLGGSAVVAAVPPEMLLPLGCIVGALAGLGVLLLVMRVRDDIVVMLLVGFLLTSIFGSLASFVMSVVQDRWELARAMLIFVLGDVSGVGPRQLGMALPLVLGAGVAAWLWGRSLDLMLSGEEEAASLGVDVVAVRRWIVVWTALLTGAAVSLGGNLGFVGLVVPHVLRSFVGASHRRLLPASALAGGIFVVACDIVSRAIPARADVPLGVITGLVGAPVFLFLLLRMRRQIHNV
jgi:iron complex transport system permease protein